MRTIQDGLTLNTTIDRVDADGDTVKCDVVVFFEVESITPGRRATWYDPGWGAEYEFSFVSAAFDGGEPFDAPGPITRDELQALMKWFYANNFAATDCANDNIDMGDAA